MLRELQEAWARSLLAGPGAPPPPGLADGGAAMAQRFGLHRNNVVGSLTEILGAAYPAVRRLAGEAWFRAAARSFVAALPPRVPQLLAYGDGFAGWLAAWEGIAALPFLPDLARLEWARMEANFAADATPLAPAALARLPQAAYPELRLVLHPSARLLDSPYPVQGLWEAPDPETAAARAGSGGERVLVVRPAAEILAVRLAPGEAALLRHLARGATLAAAAGAALAAQPDLDLMACLAAHLVRGTFSAALRPQEDIMGALT